MADRTPQIPSINATNAPSGTRLPANARGQQMLSGGAALQSIGTALDNISEADTRLEMQKAQAEQSIWLSQARSSVELQAQKMLEDKQRSAQPGQKIAPDVEKDWPSLINDQLDAAKDNPTLKARLMEHLDSVKTTALKTAQDFDARQNDAMVINNLTNTIGNKTAMYAGMQDRDAISARAQNDLGEMESNIQSLPLTPDTKLALLNQMRKGIVFAALDAKTALDPLAALHENAPARSPLSSQSDMNLPRGIRNHNPGNLRGDQGFMGFSGVDDKGFAVFESPEAGLRALAINLRNQQDLHGLNSVADIVSKYAPSSENDTGGYIAQVSKALGVKPDERINLHDPQTLASLMNAVIKQENSVTPYSSKNILYAATQAAQPGSEGDNPGMQRADGGARTGDPLFSLLHPDEQRHMIDRMETLYRQKQKDNRESAAAATGLIQQANEYLKTGFAVDDNQIQLIQDMAAKANNPALAAKVSEIQVKNQAIRDFTQMTPVDLQGYLQTALLPDIQSGKAAPEQVQRYATGTQMLGMMQKQLKSDPLGWYAHTGGNVPPLNLADPAALQERVNTARTVSNLYGVSAGTAFWTPAERDYVAQQMASGSPQMQMKTLQMLGGGITDPAMYRDVIQQIRPDSPVTAMAGMYLGLNKQLTTENHWFSQDETITPQTVAQRLLEGEALLNPTKSDKASNGTGKSFPMPPDGNDNTAKGLRPAFDLYVGNAFRGMPELAGQAYQAYRAFYAAEAAKRGNYSGLIDDNLANYAAKAVVGTVVEKNGTQVIAPWGMDATNFNDLGLINFNLLIKEHGFNADKIRWDNIRLENKLGDSNQYLINIGAGYLLDKNGLPLTLNFDTKATVEYAKSIVGDKQTDLSADEYSARQLLYRLEKK